MINNEILQTKIETQRYISCYMFEFHQGNHPEVIWQLGPKLDNCDDIMWYTVTTPVAQDSPLCSNDCSLFVATFEFYKIYSFYSLVPDVQARGFTRTLCLCVAIDTRSKRFDLPLDTITKISEIFKKSVETSYDSFKKDFSNHIGSLNATLASYPESSNFINSIINEIIPIAKSLNVTPNENMGPKKPEYFNQINNDLRKVDTLFDISILINGMTAIFDEIIDIIPYGKVFLASYPETKKYLHFGGISGDNYSNAIINILKNSHSINNSQYLISSYQKSRVLQHCIYSIFRCIPLVIETSDKEAAISLAKKFSIYVPGYTENKMVYVDKITEPSILEKYSLIVTNYIDRNIERMVSILNPELKYYEGPLCPVESIVDRGFNFETNSDSTFMIFSLMKLKDIENKFVTFVKLHNVDNSLQDNLHINFYDKQLLSNWNDMMLLKGLSNVIQMVDQSSIPWGIASFY